MSVLAGRTISVQFSGDVYGNETFAAASNAASPGEIQPVALSTGANTITPPPGAVACTITKPTGNTVALTLKGVSGDTGIALHLTDPDSVSLGGAGTFVLNAAAPVTVRLTWS